MTEKFNLKAIGINYTILDKDTQETDSIRVIEADELYAAIGQFTGTDYTYINSHIAELLKSFCGFVYSPYYISWYSATERHFDLSHAIVQARKEGNNIVVIERLPDDTIDKPPKIS